MASIRQRVRANGDVAYQVLFRHNGRQRSETFNNARAQKTFRRNVEMLGAEVALEILNAQDDSHSDMPNLGDYMLTHIEQLSGITDGTRRHYINMAKRIQKYRITKLPLDAIREGDVTKWIAQQEKEGLSGKTIKDRHSMVSASLARAIRDELVTVNWAKGARIKRTIRDEMVILMPHEFQLLCERISPHYRPLFRFMYGTGTRIGEATAIQVQDLRLHEKPGTVSIVRAWKYTAGRGHELGAPKTARGRRTISLPGDIVPELRGLAAGKKPTDYVFTNTHGGPIRQNTIWGSWKTWIDDDNYPGRPALGKEPRMHDLRHSHASWLIGKGMNLLEIQHRLGHESIQTTAGTYGHLMPEAQVQAARHAQSMFTEDTAPKALPGS